MSILRFKLPNLNSNFNNTKGNMMNHLIDQPISEVEQIAFEHLSPIQDLNKSGCLISEYIIGHKWSDSFNCITQLRKINKFHMEQVPNILENLGISILDLLNSGKSLLVKNILLLIKQMFSNGQAINVEKAVYIFLPVLIKKASTDIGNIKLLAQEVLIVFSNNCGYECSLVIVAGFTSDKNPIVAELSVKLLEVLAQNIGQAIMQLSKNTLNCFMKCLSNMVDGKRKSLQSAALDICLFVCRTITSDNYLNLMNFCLKQEEVMSMGSLMENHRVKNKAPSLKQVIKNRRTQILNADFFNKDFSLNNSFVELQQTNMIPKDQHYNNSNSYNSSNNYGKYGNSTNYRNENYNTNNFNSTRVYQ